jgi:dipeptidase D
LKGGHSGIDIHLGSGNKLLARCLDTEMEEPKRFPGWQPNVASPLLDIAVKIFKALDGQAPKVKAIHAGLGCGLFGEKFPG